MNFNSLTATQICINVKGIFKCVHFKAFRVESAF